MLVDTDIIIKCWESCENKDLSPQLNQRPVHSNVLLIIILSVIIIRIQKLLCILSFTIILYYLASIHNIHLSPYLEIIYICIKEKF